MVQLLQRCLLVSTVNGPGNIFKTFKSIKIKDKETSLVNKQDTVAYRSVGKAPVIPDVSTTHR
jgi:hypothetical protein